MESFCTYCGNPGPQTCDACAEDICGLCGEPGADKAPLRVYWPGQRRPETPYVHADCEAEECGRAHAALSVAEREAFLQKVARRG